MDDCALNGNYCQFNTAFLNLLSILESEEWFSTYKTGEIEYNFNEITGEIDATPKMAEFFEVNYMSDIVLDIIREIQESENEANVAKPTLLLQKLQSFNFTGEFGSQDNKPGGGGGPPSGGPPSGRKKRRIVKKRKKRKIGPNKVEPESYTELKLKLNRFNTAFGKILTSLTSSRKKRQVDPENRAICNFVKNILFAIGDESGIRDGAYFNMAKIKYSSYFNHQLDYLEEISNKDLDCTGLIEEKAVILKEHHLEELKEYAKYKEFDDGYNDRIRYQVSIIVRD